MNGFVRGVLLLVSNRGGRCSDLHTNIDVWLDVSAPPIAQFFMNRLAGSLIRIGPVVVPPGQILVVEPPGRP